MNERERTAYQIVLLQLKYDFWYERKSIPSESSNATTIERIPCSRQISIRQKVGRTIQKKRAGKPQMLTSRWSVKFKTLCKMWYDAFRWLISRMTITWYHHQYMHSSALLLSFSVSFFCFAPAPVSNALRRKYFHNIELKTCVLDFCLCYRLF